MSMFKLNETIFVSMNKIQSMVFTSPTTVSIWWENGQAGHYTATEKEIEGLRSFHALIAQCDTELQEDHMRKLIEKGPYYEEIERAEAQENTADYRVQRQKLRDEGLYGHVEYIGARYQYIIESEGKQFQSGSFTITAEDVAGTADRL